jgi:hypothetical protein
VKNEHRARDKSDGSDKSRSTASSSDLDLHLVERRATTAIKQIVSLILNDHGVVADERASATWSLHRLTFLAVDSLGLIARKEPSLIRPIAETSVVWPAFISRHGDFRKANVELMEILNLGKDHFFRFTFPKGKRGKRWSLKTPANVYAIKMIQGLYVAQCACRSIYRERRNKKLNELLKRSGFRQPKITFLSARLAKQILNLDPPSGGTANQWFDAAWEVLLDRTRGHPEKDEQLRKLGVHRKGHTTTAKPGSKTSESNIRDGIKERLREAFFEVISRRPNSQ